jgi:hypothetical protein
MHEILKSLIGYSFFAEVGSNTCCLCAGIFHETEIFSEAPVHM